MVLSRMGKLGNSWRTVSKRVLTNVADFRMWAASDETSFTVSLEAGLSGFGTTAQRLFRPDIALRLVI